MSRKIHELQMAAQFAGLSIKFGEFCSLAWGHGRRVPTSTRSHAPAWECHIRTFCVPSYILTVGSCFPCETWLCFASEKYLLLRRRSEASGVRAFPSWSLGTRYKSSSYYELRSEAELLVQARSQAGAWERGTGRTRKTKIAVRLL